VIRWIYSPKNNEVRLCLPYYWIPKLQKNVERDAHVLKELKDLGYNVLVIWECEVNLKNEEKADLLIKKLSEFLILPNS